VLGGLGDQDSLKSRRMQRLTCTYVNHDEKFRIKKRDYDRQFSQLYFYRLAQLRPQVVEAAKRAWPGVEYVRVLDVPEEKEVFIVGTLYKEMSLKPSILDEYTKDVASHVGGTKFTDASDVAVLEDEGGRVSLVGEKFNVGKYVTGVIVAVKGKVLESGDFEVNDTCFAGLAPQMPIKAKGNEDRYVALVSGFSMGGDIMGPSNTMLKIQMMLDYCSGILGTEPEQKMASHIVRVVFAGGILKGTSKLSQPTSYASVREQATALEPMHDADALLYELCEHVDLDIMPGVADPTNYSLPQQPFHRCLLPQTTSLSSLTRCTNPHSFEMDNVQFLGTSGQNVDDVSRYSTFESTTEILQEMLAWRHIIPTAPDSLAAYPYSDEDPFILEQAPHVFFAGGQPSYQSTFLEGPDGQKTRIISVPEFALDPVMVLVNLRNLDVHPIRFDAFM
jgi:DNA polymerase delta subunit 2